MKPRRLVKAASLVATLMIGGAVSAQSEDASGSEGGANFLLRTLWEDAVRCRVQEITPESNLKVAARDGRAREVALADCIQLVNLRDDKIMAPAGWTVRLIGGDVLHGWPAEVAEDALVIDTRELGQIEIPLDYVRAYESPLARDPRWRPRVASLLEEARTQDVVLLSNGDALGGFITRVDHDHVLVETLEEVAKIDRDVIVALALPPAPPPERADPLARAQLRHGSRLTLRRLTWREGEVEALTLFDAPVRFNADHLVSLSFHGGRWEYLTESEPSAFTHMPMLSLDWPYRENRNVLGEPMRVADRTFESGIGVHSRSVLSFDLKGRYREFVTFFGVDDESGSWADVTVRIDVDGQTRFSSEHVRRGKLHGPFRVSLSPQASETDAPESAARELRLVVDFGDNGDVQDRFNWIEPLLIKR